MEFHNLHYTIDSIIQRIKTGRLALPDFQREFVWNPSRVAELLDSVARQWPIGSLLLLSGPQPFAIRAIDCGPMVDPEGLDLYILDGQQRVTSLYHAITDTSDFCYYINFKSLAEGDDDYVQWEKRGKFQKNYPSIRERASNEIALIKEVWDLENFYKWLEHLRPEASKFEIVSLRERKLGGLQAKVYKAMAIQLDQEIELEALARIFETLNRTGVRLNAFDLMVAALYPSGFKLRDAWESAIDQKDILKQINPDAIEVLKLVALIVRFEHGKNASRGVRQGDLLRIERSLIKETWPKALQLYIDSLEYCKKHFGVICGELVPSWSMILGVAGWLYKGDANDKTIWEWWTERLKTQYFGQAANTRVVSDFEIIMTPKPEFSFRNNSEGFDSIYEPTKSNRLLLKGLGGLLIARGATDLITGLPLNNEELVCFRAITENGEIRRVRNNDNLLSILVISEPTDRKIGTCKSIAELGINTNHALQSQGVDPISLRRAKEFINETFDGPGGD